jgi:hypothetical protein
MAERVAYWQKQALAVQTACNVSGVVHSMAELMRVLQDAPECQGTDWRNHHPLTVLFSVGIGWLSFGCLCSPDLYGWAYRWADEERDSFAYEPYEPR